MTATTVLGLLMSLLASSEARWLPAPGTTFHIQFSGTLNLNVDAQAYDIDLLDTPLSAITTLHSQGKKVICYFSAGTHENWRTDVNSVPESALGADLPDWPGERYWDIRVQAVRDVILHRLDLAVSRGCDAVDPDNIDSYAANNGLGLTRAHQVDFNTWIATQAHQRDLSVGQKNAIELISSLEQYFDWALNESCLEYSECLEYQVFLDHNKAVFHIEYVDSTAEGPSKQAIVCHSSSRPSQFSTNIKKWELSAWRLTC